MKRFGIWMAAMLLLLCGCTGTPEETETPQTQPPEPGNGVRLSHDSGVYPEEFLLTMSGPGQILYTLDGSDPTESTTAIVYEGPVSVTDRAGEENVVSAVEPVLFAGSWNTPNSSRDGFACQLNPPQAEAVDKCTVIRAVARLDGGSFSQEVCATYFIGTTQGHIPGLAESCQASGTPLAVISISVSFADLFDSTTGIYVKGDIFQAALEDYLASGQKLRDGETARSLDANYKQRGREWERNATVTMLEFTPEGAEAVLTQQCGIRIQGNYSRSDAQKGLRLIARDEYGDNNFRYPVFGEEYKNDGGETMDKFKSLVLRAGGNCAFTAKFNDTYWQSLCHDTACETKRSRPCVVYLNGEYWGLYVLEEDYTADFLEDVHGVEKNDVVIYKGDAETYDIGYKLDEGELPEGEETDYYFRPLLDFFEKHTDLKDQAVYEEFITLVDPASVMDYFAVQCFINNKWDWPGKNWSMWRTTETDPENPYADGRWRFLFYDMEFGGVSGESDAKTNTIKEDNYKPKGLLDMDTDNPAVLCFAYLMTHPGFREGFYQRLQGLSVGTLEKEAALERLAWFEAVYGPLFNQFFERYPGTGSTQNALRGGYASSRCIRQFLQEREDYIQQMIEYCRRTL